MLPYKVDRAANPLKVSKTKIFKDMLKDGWKIVSKKKQKENTFLVVLRKVVEAGKKFGKEIKTFLVGREALPKSLKVNKIPKHGSNRQGAHKLSRMNYA